MPSDFTTILFDLDDTLADTMLARVVALNSAFTRHGISSHDASEFLQPLRGRQLKHTLEELGASPEMTLKIMDDYVKLYWQLGAGQVILYPGVRAILESLHKEGIRLGVITQKERAFDFDGTLGGAARELAEMGVADFFSTVVGFEDVTNHKPHPEPVLLALQHLGGDPKRTLVVGDSIYDIQAARAAGCWNCVATWGHEKDSKYDHFKADFIAHKPEAVLELKLL